ncbi:hypothetical protein SAMN04488004_13028 [Loktanella salsilacus]|uniref:Uncharacterized protein n=1 Tax=Loktanella salsilacus TaxID=195913 RepID=A0A1I4IYQ3_9RHOB|nr:hypothetical protein SAMN04488004_13028 [Loktanella salsilacus]
MSDHLPTAAPRHSYSYQTALSVWAGMSCANEFAKKAVPRLLKTTVLLLFMAISSILELRKIINYKQ